MTPDDDVTPPSPADKLLQYINSLSTLSLAELDARLEEFEKANWEENFPCSST